MKYFIPLLLISLSLFITACDNSSYSSGKDITTRPHSSDNVKPWRSGNLNNQGNPQYISNHCSNISNQKHTFYGYMKNVINRGSYKDLIESQTDCRSYSGWVRYANANATYEQYQYERYDGTANCTWWSQQPMGITVSFFKGYNKTATIAIDATANGWAYAGGQGFPVRRMIFNGRIDCTQKDLTIDSYTPQGWLTITVEKEHGNKHTPSMRANISFNDVDLGKQQLIRK